MGGPNTPASPSSARAGRLSAVKEKDASSLSARKASRQRTPLTGPSASSPQQVRGSGTVRGDKVGGSLAPRLGLHEDGSIRVAMGKRVVRLCLPRSIQQDMAAPARDTSEGRESRASRLSGSGQLPRSRLQLEWAYGYSGGSLFLANDEEVVYPAAAVVVVHHIENHTQRFFTGHDDLVTSLAVHRSTGLALSGQRVGRGGSQPHASLWRVSDQVEIARLVGHGRQVGCVSFSATGSHAYVGGVSSQGLWQVCIWKVDSLIHSTLAKGRQADSLVVGSTAVQAQGGGAPIADEPLLRVPLQVDTIQSLQVHPETDCIVLVHSARSLGFVTMPSLVPGAGARVGNRPYTRLAEFGRVDPPQSVTCAAFVGGVDEAMGAVYAAVGTSDGRLILLSEHENGTWRAVTALSLARGPNCRVTFIESTKYGIICGGGSDCGLNCYGPDLQPLRERLPVVIGNGQLVHLQDAVHMETPSGSVMILGTRDGMVLQIPDPYAFLDEVSLTGTLLVGPQSCKIDGPDNIEEVVTALAAHPTMLTRVASGDTLGRVCFYDTGSCEMLRTVPPHQCRAAICCLTYAPSGGFLVAGLADGTLEVLAATEWGELFGTRQSPMVEEEEFLNIVSSVMPDLATEVIEEVWSQALADAALMLGEGQEAEVQAVPAEVVARVMQVEETATLLGTVRGFVSLPELHDSVRISGESEAITALEFAPTPTGQAPFLAAAATDGTVSLLSCCFTGSASLPMEQHLRLEPHKVLQAGASAVLSIQFSTCGRYLATSGRDSPLLFWEVGLGQRAADNIVQDLEWFVTGQSASQSSSTGVNGQADYEADAELTAQRPLAFHQWRLPIGWPVIGLCNRLHANPGLLVHSAKHHRLCAASSDHFDVALYRFPLPTEAAKGYTYFSHGGKTICCCWTGKDQLVTASSRSDVLLQWRLAMEPEDPVAMLRKRRLSSERAQDISAVEPTPSSNGHGQPSPRTSATGVPRSLVSQNAMSSPDAVAFPSSEASYSQEQPAPQAVQRMPLLIRRNQGLRNGRSSYPTGDAGSDSTRGSAGIRPGEVGTPERADGGTTARESLLHTPSAASARSEAVASRGSPEANRSISQGELRSAEMRGDAGTPGRVLIVSSADLLPSMEAVQAAQEEPIPDLTAPLWGLSSASRGHELEMEESAIMAKEQPGELEDMKRKLHQAVRENEALQRRNQELERRDAENKQRRVDLEREKTKMEERSFTLQRLISGNSVSEVVEVLGTNSNASMTTASQLMSVPLAPATSRPTYIPSLRLSPHQSSQSASSIQGFMTAPPSIVEQQVSRPEVEGPAFGSSYGRATVDEPTPRVLQAGPSPGVTRMVSAPRAAESASPRDLIGGAFASSPQVVPRLPSSPYLGGPSALVPTSPRLHSLTGGNRNGAGSTSSGPRRLKSAPMSALGPGDEGILPGYSSAMVATTSSPLTPSKGEYSGIPVRGSSPVPQSGPSLAAAASAAAAAAVAASVRIATAADPVPSTGGLSAASGASSSASTSQLPQSRMGRPSTASSVSWRRQSSGSPKHWEARRTVDRSPSASARKTPMVLEGSTHLGGAAGLSNSTTTVPIAAGLASACNIGASISGGPGQPASPPAPPRRMVSTGLDGKAQNLILGPYTPVAATARSLSPRVPRSPAMRCRSAGPPPREVLTTQQVISHSPSSGGHDMGMRPFYSSYPSAVGTSSGAGGNFFGVPLHSSEGPIRMTSAGQPFLYPGSQATPARPGSVVPGGSPSSGRGSTRAPAY